jgi:hypothetical protein
MLIKIHILNYFFFLFFLRSGSLNFNFLKSDPLVTLSCPSLVYNNIIIYNRGSQSCKYAGKIICVYIFKLFIFINWQIMNQYYYYIIICITNVEFFWIILIMNTNQSKKWKLYITFSYKNYHRLGKNYDINNYGKLLFKKCMR